MDIGEFKTTVAGFMNRETSAFLVTSTSGKTTDLLLTAANNAKLFAQRKMLFEWAKSPVSFIVSPVAGANCSVGRVLRTNNLVGIRHLLRASVVINNQRIPADLVTLESATEDAKRQGEFIVSPVNKFNYTAPGRPRVIISGSVMYVQGVDTTADVEVICDAYHWLLPYQDQPAGNPPPTDWPGRTDFFLNYCVDWMLYRSIQELNLFLKEDQRQPISMSFVNEAWETVKTWNTNLTNATDDWSLD